MKAKNILYFGILVLIIGVLFRYLSPFPSLGLSLIISGVVLKLSYITHVMLIGHYKPGAEIFLLLVGLAFLFLGIWHKFNVSAWIGHAMIGLAILLKIIFIIVFVRKRRITKAAINS